MNDRLPAGEQLSKQAGSHESVVKKLKLTITVWPGTGLFAATGNFCKQEGEAARQSLQERLEALQSQLNASVERAKDAEVKMRAANGTPIVTGPCAAV